MYRVCSKVLSLKAYTTTNFRAIPTETCPFVNSYGQWLRIGRSGDHFRPLSDDKLGHLANK